MSSPRRDDQDCERKILGSRDTARSDPFGEELRDSPVLPDSAVPPDSHVLPDRSRDDSDLGWGDPDHDRDEELQREVPPHHY